MLDLMLFQIALKPSMSVISFEGWRTATVNRIFWTNSCFYVDFLKALVISQKTCLGPCFIYWH